MSDDIYLEVITTRIPLEGTAVTSVPFPTEWPDPPEGMAVIESEVGYLEPILRRFNSTHVELTRARLVQYGAKVIKLPQIPYEIVKQDA